MSSKQQNHQKAVRYFKEITGKTEVDLDEVAGWMIQNGHVPPVPKTPRQLLAKALAASLREETRYDKKTGRPYRVNHSYPMGAGTGYLWFDIDENPPRKKMLFSLVNRREQMVGDAMSMYTDQEHWNNENPGQEPIQLPLDFKFDVELRLNAPGEEAA